MEEVTLEREFLARAFQHRYAVLGAYLTQEYIQDQMRGTITIPKFLVEQEAEKYSSEKIQYFMSNGTFNEEYEKAWTKIVGQLPC